MKQHIQNTLFGLSILLILSTLVSAYADTAKTTTSEVVYRYYYRENSFTKRYHRFFPNPAPEDLHYYTRMDTTANVDDTPEKENIALIVIDTKQGADFGNWHQAFLLITNTKARRLEKKALFKLFDTGTYTSEVPAAKAIALHNSSFVSTEPINVSFRLVDLTGDGTVDVWVESEHGVALISFENGEFLEVFSNYTITREKFTETPKFEYHYYDNLASREGQTYHRFLAAPPPEGLRYTTVMKAMANIDDTPEKENIVLMIANGGEEWVQAFLLITDTQADGSPKKKELFKLFDAGTHHFDVPGKTIEFQSAPFVFTEWISGITWDFINATHFSLVDLTGDGILDIWVECAYGVAVISFQDSEFVEVCSADSSPRREDPIEYIDIDNDGIYEIKIPDSIHVKGGPGAAALEWMSFYEWDGTTYVLNNRRFYANNDKFFARLLEAYNFWHYYAIQDEYSFYIGLVFYYRGNPAMAQKYLQWVVRNAKNDDYIEAAASILKQLTHH
ncbi:hypothetical protein F4Y93_08410 [Candidatus Poribacteria bacterium]|nr:hypothetical protein [Candidatus Poribacteria bacterium]